MSHPTTDRRRGGGGGAPRLKPCVSHDVLARLGDKWTTSVVWLLAEAPGRRLRFFEVRGGIDGITQRMLTVTLRGLERDGLVERHYFPEVPPRVEYELTDLGHEMFQALQGFADWLGRSWPRVEVARQTFDAAQMPKPRLVRTWDPREAERLRRRGRTGERDAEAAR